jgi:hypothetical protein
VLALFSSDAVATDILFTSAQEVADDSLFATSEQVIIEPRELPHTSVARPTANKLVL